jgi:thiol-disulfide isomerase/thioredoxin
MTKIHWFHATRPRLFTPLNALALMLLLVVSAASSAASPPLGHLMEPIAPPLPAADFTLADVDGEPLRLADLRGKVVMLNFWASWCPPCRREMPSMQRLYQQYAEQGLVVVAVNQWEDADLVFEFVGRLDPEPSFPILLDRGSKVAELYGVKGLPTTYLIDRDGNMRYRAMGGRDFDHPAVAQLIESLF